MLGSRDIIILLPNSKFNVSYYLNPENIDLYYDSWKFLVDTWEFSVYTKWC